MKMIQQLLIAAACGLIVAEPNAASVPSNVIRKIQRLPYKQATAALAQAEATLEANLLSMEGDIPLLNDFRRHYAVIAHVIMNHAVMLRDCLVQPIMKVYHQYLNISIPEALSNPEKVIDEYKKLLNKVNKDAKKLIDLTNACVLEDSVCDEFMHNVEQSTVVFNYPALILRTAGTFASTFNELNSSFEPASKNLEAIQFVIRNPHLLIDIVSLLNVLITDSEVELNPYECIRN